MFIKGTDRLLLISVIYETIISRASTYDKSSSTVKISLIKNLFLTVLSEPVKDVIFLTGSVWKHTHDLGFHNRDMHTFRDSLNPCSPWTAKDVRLTNHWLSSNDSFSLTCLHCLSWWSAKVSLPSHGSILESRDPKTLLCSSKIKKF